MLIHLVYNSQLKTPVKGLKKMQVVVVDAQGNALQAIDGMSLPSIIGKAMVSYEVRVIDIKPVMETVMAFRELVRYMSNEFIPTVTEEMVRQLLSSQSLTIAFVTKQLNIPRASAKEFIERCVQCGAYKKYYSYWVRTDLFASWMAQQR